MKKFRKQQTIRRSETKIDKYISRPTVHKREKREEEEEDETRRG
jgi:hypothetical protein